MRRTKKFARVFWAIVLSICILTQNQVPVSAESDEKESVTSIKENKSATIPVSVDKAGVYNVTIDYLPVADETSSIKFELLIDGEIMSAESKNISLKRIWKDSDEKEYDSQGNQIRLPSTQTPSWQRETLKDSTGFQREALKFELEAGVHNVTFAVYQNTLVLGNVELTPFVPLPSYKEIAGKYENGQYNSTDSTKRLEAENASAKSDRSIVLLNDKTSPDTVPYSGKEIVYNSIGGGSWKTVGEWVEWDIEVPEDGLYTIETRYKQDQKSNDVSFRTLYIDGEIPFEEARFLAFYYDGDWKTEAFGNKDGAYKFYLTKGIHTFRLEASLGEYNEVIKHVKETLTKLNKVYTNIVMVTGTDPDLDRDYQFEKSIPEVLQSIGDLSLELKETEKELEDLTGETGGENASTIRRLHIQLDAMLDDTDTIAKRLNDFSSNLSSLGTWINTSQEQPLQLDYIMLIGDKASADEQETGFWSNLWSSIKYFVNQFSHSFVVDYANIGNKEADVEKEITVWISSGRDQADIIRQLVNESFIPENGIGVNVQLVDAGALTSATLAGVGPDVYIGMGQSLPVDYALRHAVVNLSQFDDVEEVVERFYPASLTPFYLDSNLYALPDTMSYPMIFYRKDILEELNVSVEDLTTWDGLLQTVLPELDMNNFDFGMLPTMNNFGCLLYQNGGSFYNETNTESAFNEAEAIAAFETMTTLYTDYSIPLSFDFANRFRSGQMPLAITDFTAYNQLSIFAPEIEGLWGMLPLPGIEDENGNVNNTALCLATGSVIMANSDFIDESWTFLKWWTSDEVQASYSRELEMVMGTGARYATANRKAMQTVEWNRDIRESLLEQQKSLEGMPSIAGGYYTSRNFDFAFRDVVYSGKNMRETIAEAARNITKEITNKRKEFYDEE